MEHETFWTLLTDLPHWEFEIFTTILFDIVIGILIWPRFVKFFRHHKEDDQKISDLVERVKKLEGSIYQS